MATCNIVFQHEKKKNKTVENRVLWTDVNLIIKKTLYYYLSDKVFRMKLLLGDTIFTSQTGHPSHLKV